MRKAVTGFVACQPVGYRTPADKPDFTSLEAFPFELDPLQLSRREMARWAQQARDLGVDYIGSCCGSVAIHVREMARALGKVAGGRPPLDGRLHQADVGVRVLRARGKVRGHQKTLSPGGGQGEGLGTTLVRVSSRPYFFPTNSSIRFSTYGKNGLQLSRMNWSVGPSSTPRSPRGASRPSRTP